MKVEFRVASKSDLEELAALVKQYHIFESINSSAKQRQTALAPLLICDSNVGFIVIAEANEIILGYLVICYGYSIEFGGRDAFVDEFYVSEAMRNSGVGSKLIDLAKEEARNSGVLTLHLEVSTNNLFAKKLYKRLGFVDRERFHLMSCRI